MRSGAAEAVPVRPLVWSDAVLALARNHRAAHLAPPQRLVYALLVRTFQSYRGDRLVTALGWIMVPVFAGVGLVLGFVGVGIAYGALAAIEGWAGLPVTAGVYGVPLFLVAFATWHRLRATDRPVELRRVDGRVDGFELGRLHEVFEASEPSVLGLFFGIAFGIQVGLLRWAADLVGLPSSGIADAALLTLDNACHGLFLDIFELYRLDFAAAPDHTYWSATLFHGFRVAFDAFAVLILLGAYRRYRVRHLFRVFPYDPRRLDELLAWVAARTADARRSPRLFPDEFLFLVLARAYLEGHLGFARHLSRQLPWLAIDPEVRALFRGPDGLTVLRGAGPPPTRG